jgi:hypothetical protein
MAPLKENAHAFDALVHYFQQGGRDKQVAVVGNGSRDATVTTTTRVRQRLPYASLQKNVVSSPELIPVGGDHNNNGADDDR